MLSSSVNCRPNPNSVKKLFSPEECGAEGGIQTSPVYCAVLMSPGCLSSFKSSTLDVVYLFPASPCISGLLRSRWLWLRWGVPFLCLTLHVWSTQEPLVRVRTSSLYRGKAHTDNFFSNFSSFYTFRRFVSVRNDKMGEILKTCFILFSTFPNYLIPLPYIVYNPEA